MAKKSILSVLLVILLLLTACGTKEDTDIRDTVKALTAKDLRGRLTGTVGNQRAAAVIEKGFQKAGLAKYDGSSYLMPFTQSVFLPNHQNYTMTAHFEGGKRKKLHYGRDFIEQNLVDNVALDGPVVFGADSSRVEGKVFVLSDEKEIKKIHGNAGAILIKKPQLVKNIHFIGANVPILHIREGVYDELVSQKAEWIQLGIDTEKTEVPANNVVGTIKGKSGADALVLTAHFDHVGWAGDQVFPGAADNAAAVGVLLDLAKELKRYTDAKPFDFDIVFCALNGAESGLKGSTALADALEKNYEQVQIINLDAMGRKEQNGLVVINSDPSSIADKLSDHLSGYFNAAGLPTAMSREQNADDPLSILTESFSAATISQGPFEGQHTTSDTVKELDFDYLNRVSEGIFKYITADEKGFSEFLGRGIASNIRKLSEKHLGELRALKLNQYKIFEIDGKKIPLMKNYDAYRTLQDVKLIFPGLDFPEKLGDLSFDNATFFAHTYIPDSVTNLEVGKVYEYPISPKNIQLMWVNYTAEALAVSISLQITSDRPAQGEASLPMDLLTPEEAYDLDTEPIHLSGDPYYIAYAKGTNHIAGLYMKKHEGDKSFSVRVDRFWQEGPLNTDSMSIWFDDSREKITAFMEENGIAEMIRDRIVQRILEK